MRVVGIDPGTVSFDVCGLDAGEPFLDLSIASPDLDRDPTPLVEALQRCGRIDLAVGPSGYGLPLVRGEQVGDGELAQMLLVRHDEAPADVGIGGMKAIIRALIATGLPLVFVPGAIHLPTIPAYRKANRIDMGTADKVCSVALGVVDQAQRYNLDYTETSFILLELGGAFSAALAVDDGQIVDGLGGSSGPIGYRASGALDGEAAYLIGGTLSKGTIFSGGAADIAGDGAGRSDFAAWAEDGESQAGWLAWLEGAVKAALTLTAVLPYPREILLSGRMSQLALVETALAERLSSVAPVRRVIGLRDRETRAPLRAKAAAQGAALLADGLAGGPFAPLVEALALHGASGTALDYLRLHGAESIRIR